MDLVEVDARERVHFGAGVEEDQAVGDVTQKRRARGVEEFDAGARESEAQIVRVDRQLSWNEVARIMSDELDVDENELSATAARLRQRFQTVKRRLRQTAEAAGLLESRRG